MTQALPNSHAVGSKLATPPSPSVRESKCVTSVTVKVLLCGNQSFIHQTMSGLLSHAS